MQSPPTPKTTKKRQKIQDERLDKAFELLQQSSSKKEEDECQIFWNLVAKKLQRYSFEIRTTVQEEIMATLFRAARTLCNSNPNSATIEHIPLPVQQPSTYSTYQQTQHSNNEIRTYAILHRPGSPTPQTPSLTNYYSTFSPTPTSAPNSQDYDQL